MSVRQSAGRTAVAGRTRSGEGIEERLEAHRSELTGYCYRMLGSAFEAEDAVQETMVRAWRGADGFEGRASLRSWLYRIATNVCLDSLKAGNRRARPMDLSPASRADAVLADRTPEADWVEPVPDVRALPSSGDPADVVVSRESIRLAFVAALQHLPPRQRAVLILREVLAWKASETAELLGTTVASVNSALQRARATLAESGVSAEHRADPEAAAASGGVPGVSAPAMDKERQALLDRYVDAFERYDLDALTSLLHEDATLSMPPYPMWLRGREEIRAWFGGTGIGCAGSRLLPVAASGAPGFGQYRRDPSGSGHHGWALQVLDVSEGRITALNSFLDVEHLFPLFGLPLELPGEPDEFDEGA
ncbi:RNA polymerase, sigma subunit, ECF family [Actinacidiphila yanglinensis]|uniref:RNA polymerase, sigma subunit, ECF family n=1 Tax=Actinacidiphila yanglinensis TaxID=310779 RepID=A0A1H5XD19_9ACTN|nr:sigma-70 family RNA polymerase sigma factor [Actinacidiphila yanglinensis]SEG09658.1 RNA polymerase, sigma subunit, ECF family [Actinacidiphila yanglinensis]